ncbi:phytanoyl-CoA dioxygenase family protein [Nocardia sp. NPDC059691]|uniref:phytanoyl-CoA dioxygenase family protein n=1 Tax=Nocardia sp. NPDC059691 TaxID=3346908 RepID=UPI003694C2E3
MAELRRRLIREGYLYLPGLLAREAVAEVSGLLESTLAATEFDGFTADSFATVYPRVQRLEAFHRLAHHDALRSLAGGLLGADVFCHPAKVVRIIASAGAESSFATRAHQDFVVQHVASDVLTVWLPFTDCDERHQGLRLIPGSHRDGFIPVDESLPGARPLYLNVPFDDERWRTAGFRIGDIVVFHSFTVHAGGPNASDRVRLSADIRYQRVSEPIRAEFLRPHGWPRTPDWDELCADWSTRAWVEVPDGVHAVPMPQDISYRDYLSTLVAPPSLLLKGN